MKNQRNWTQLIFLVVVAGLLISNVTLIVQNLRLRREIDAINIYVTEKGYKFNKLQVRNPDGTDTEFDFSTGGKNTLLLYFDPACEYCTQQYPYWKDLASKLNADKWNVVLFTRSIMYEQIKSHLKANNLENIKVQSIRSKDASNARLGFTPMTIVINPNGVVEKVWKGLWQNSNTEPITEAVR